MFMKQIYKQYPQLGYLFGIDVKHLTRKTREELLDMITPKCCLGATSYDDNVAEVRVTSPTLTEEPAMKGLPFYIIAGRGSYLSLTFQRQHRIVDFKTIFEPLKSSSFFASDRTCPNPYGGMRPRIYGVWLSGEVLTFDLLPNEVKKTFENSDYVFRKPLPLTEADMKEIKEANEKWNQFRLK